MQLTLFLVTVAVELVVALLCIRHFWMDPRPGAWRLTLVVFGVNAVSHPIAWWLCSFRWAATSPGLQWSAVELGVALLEGVLLAWGLRAPTPAADRAFAGTLALSFAMNGVTAAIGLLLSLSVS